MNTNIVRKQWSVTNDHRTLNYKKAIHSFFQPQYNFTESTQLVESTLFPVVLNTEKNRVILSEKVAIRTINML